MAESSFSYKEYVVDKEFLDDYNTYQGKYAEQIRESDRIVIEMVRALAKERTAKGGPLRLLDIGCSTGNLLLHLKRLVPGIALTGGDLAESSLAECRANPQLAGIEFRTMNILDLHADTEFDVVTVNAVLYMMDDEQFRGALDSIRAALRRDGTMIVFDFFHPFPQDLTLNEVSKSHPKGLRLRFRPMPAVEATLGAAGFVNPVFRPFTLPIDLPLSGGPEDLITYTVPTQDGRKLPFRGTLFQPWCHLRATKGG